MGENQVNPPRTVDDDELVGYSRQAGTVTRASRHGGIIDRLNCALLRASDGRRISVDRISAANDLGAMLCLIQIACNRHRGASGDFKGWWVWSVSAIRSFQPVRLVVVQNAQSSNRFHSEIIFPEDLRDNDARRKALVNRLKGLGRWECHDFLLTDSNG